MAKVKEKENKSGVKKTKKGTGWYEVVSFKEEFRNIVRILNRYYTLHPVQDQNPSHNFREEIVNTELENLRIFLKKFGGYEYLVVVEISNEFGSKMDSWIHIDGVSQERAILTQKGILEHPVYKIISVEDLFLSHTKTVEKGLQPKLEDLIL